MTHTALSNVTVTVTMSRVVQAQAVLVLAVNVQARDWWRGGFVKRGCVNCTKTMRMVELQTTACEKLGSVHRSSLACHVGRPMQATPE
jgi:hypothetical protein